MGSSAGLEITAATIGLDDLDRWSALLRLEMTGSDPVCIVSVTVELDDSSGTMLGRGIVLIDSPMYASFDSPTQCLGNGDVGMGSATISVAETDIPKIARVRYGLSGNIDPDATPITGISIQGVMVSPFSATKVEVTGRIANGGNVTYQDPQVHLYPLDSAGRPLAQGFDIELVSLPAGGSWDFSMYVLSPVDDFMPFAEFDLN